MTGFSILYRAKSNKQQGPFPVALSAGMITGESPWI